MEDSKAKLPHISTDLSAAKTGLNAEDDKDAFSPTYESGGDENGQGTGEDGDFEDGASLG